MLVYKITNLVNGKLYFGITGKTLERRWKAHRQHAFGGKRPRGGALQAAMRKYGWAAFTMELVCEAATELDAAMAERQLIADYGTLSPNGYNRTTGGELAPKYHFSPDFIREMSERRKADPTRFERAHKASKGAALVNRGSKKSDEMRANMRAAQKVRREKEQAAGGIPYKPHNFSPEERERRRLSMLEKMADGRIKKGFYGKHSEESRQKMSEANKTPERLAAHRANMKLRRILSDEQVREIRRRTADGCNQNRLAKEFGISPQLLSFVKTGRYYGDVGTA